MGVNTRNNIVTNGLVMCLDAANPMSYTSGSTLWRDVSGNRNSGSLINGPIFDRTDGGSIVTDGVDDFIIVGGTQTAGFQRGLHWDLNWTLETWVRPVSWAGAQAYKYIYGNYNGSAPPTYPSMPIIIINGAATPTSNIQYLNSAEGNSTQINTSWMPTITGSWNHLVATFEGGTSFKIYLNGILTGSATFNSSSNFGYINCVEVIKIDSSNKPWVGGTFERYNGVPISYGIARLNESGSFDSTWTTGSSESPRLSGFNHKVQDIEFTGSEIHITGMYRYFKNTLNYCGIRVNYTGSKTGFNPLFNYGIASIKTNSSSKSYVCIGFSNFMGNSNARFHRLNSDGTFDSTFATGSGFNDNTYVVRLDSSEKPIVGGLFTTYSGSTYQRIIRLNTDGTIDTSFNSVSGFNNGVYTIAIDSSQKIYVGGVFTTYKGVAANRIIRLNTDGTKDTAFDNSTGFDSSVTSIEIDADGKLLVVGDFTTYKGVSYPRIIRLNTDGTIDTSFNPGAGFDRVAKTIAFESGSTKIYVGGSFFSYSGSLANGIVKLNSNGSIDTTFNSGVGFSRANDRPAESAPQIAGTTNGYFNGKWAGVKLYNRALSEREVLQNYNATKARFNLL